MKYDILIRNGSIADGSGSAAFPGDIGIMSDTIAAIGDLRKARGVTEIDAAGLTVAPGFINMLSWAVESLIEDGRSLGDICQGVTLEVLGEGDSWGPWNESMKQEMKASQGDPSRAARHAGLWAVDTYGRCGRRQWPRRC